MRDQYAGDISDLLKFSLLRQLAGGDRTLGMAWYYVNKNDGRCDGRHLEWRDDASWQRFDGVLHAALAALPERSIAALESSPIWPKGVLFHREPMPSAAGRNMWAHAKRHKLEVADLIFLDPDNGIGNGSERHATFPELKSLRRPSRCVVFITFPGRQATHEVQLETLHDRLRLETGTENIVTLRTSVRVPQTANPTFFVPRIRWFTVIDHDAQILLRLTRFMDHLHTHTTAKAKLFTTS